MPFKFKGFLRTSNGRVDISVPRFCILLTILWGTEEEKDNSISYIMENLVQSTKEFILCLVIAILLFKLGGWNLVCGKEMSSHDLITMHIVARHPKSAAKSGVYATKSLGFISNDKGLLVRVNKRLFGVYKDNHIFDSPVIQWIMLSFSIGAIFVAIERLYNLIIEMFYIIKESDEE